MKWSSKGYLLKEFHLVIDFLISCLIVELGNDTSADISKYKQVTNVDFKDQKFIEILNNASHPLHEKAK